MHRFPACIAAAALALAAALPQATSAQSPQEAAAQNMQLAAEICLRNYRDPGATEPQFREAGFQVGPGMDAGSFEFSAPGGVMGIAAPAQGRSYCTVMSEQVPLATAEAIGRALGERLFPGNVTAGSPEQQAGSPVPPCGGLSIFAPQRLIRITYAQAGNSGECINDGTSAIIINM
ncbi:hypothetical protein SAMN05216196_104235 [Lutimaribacter pacificus]|uniref:Uncharacterized protein n=1 Tax=Lutimaribacter pacificus TaxID=391948 RepID=A0A1H0I472_9RHOB|nr:hypothetical protein [Lutimaribacter pacificus]SDO26222.1 hypothetical protein SAMN05216196_104235 [Lutimaribacter pacificus]SHK26704.1 hypothetical protein SAMN05444142_104150 [Lutimaribacter pacificus]